MIRFLQFVLLGCLVLSLGCDDGKNAKPTKDAPATFKDKPGQLPAPPPLPPPPPMPGK